jgi:hypothetical protein
MALKTIWTLWNLEVRICVLWRLLGTYRDKETGRFRLQFCHRRSVEDGGFIWVFRLSDRTARSKPIKAFDDAINQHCAWYLLVSLVSGDISWKKYMLLGHILGNIILIAISG